MKFINLVHYSKEEPLKTEFELNFDITQKTNPNNRTFPFNKRHTIY